MDWSTFGVLVLAGVFGAFIGMRISRYLKRRKEEREE